MALVAVLNHPQRIGSELLLIDATCDGKLLTRKKLRKNIKAVTGMGYPGGCNILVVKVRGISDVYEHLAT